jgi:hypothetical protein
VSLEFGAVAIGKNETKAETAARIMAIGDALSKQRLKEKGIVSYPQYYHNRESFSKTLGNAEVFASLVSFVRSKLEKFATFSEKQERQVAAN